LSNICGVIHSIHIPLAKRPSKRYFFVALDYYNIKKSHSIVLQVVCDAPKMFWNVCDGQLGGVHDGGQLKTSNLYHELRIQQSFQEPMIIIQVVKMKPYLIGDFAFPYIRIYKKIGSHVIQMMYIKRNLIIT
jgi:hypothetical protein